MHVGDLWRVGGNLAVSRAIGKLSVPINRIIFCGVKEILLLAFVSCTVKRLLHL